MSAPPFRPFGPLRADILHLYRARLDAPPAPAPALADLLSPSERERADRFHFDRDRRRYRASTGLLRLLLGTVVDVEPRDLGFELGPHGKPALLDGPSFNVSHSGDWWFCGVAVDGRVGVDVEVHRRLSDLSFLARGTFHADEAAAVLSRPDEPARHAAFFRVWSRKEAFIKAVGMGLAYPLDGFVVSAEDQTGELLLEVTDPADNPGRWHMESVTWAADLAAAIAWDRPGGHAEWRAFPDGTA